MGQTTVVDLWPQSFGKVEIPGPLAIMKQQARLLGQKTKNVVEGHVMSEASGSGKNLRIQSNFYLLAPALSGYRHLLFSIEHGIRTYPLVFVNKSKRYIALAPSPTKDVSE